MYTRESSSSSHSSRRRGYGAPAETQVTHAGALRRPEVVESRVVIVQHIEDPGAIENIIGLVVPVVFARRILVVVREAVGARLPRCSRLAKAARDGPQEEDRTVDLDAIRTDRLVVVERPDEGGGKGGGDPAAIEDACACTAGAGGQSHRTLSWTTS
eukprot:4468712-Prymnesium_polylepis.1